MTIKYFSAAVAVILVIAYLIPVAVKLKEAGLVAVILIGIGMMLVDLWQSLQSKED